MERRTLLKAWVLGTLAQFIGVRPLYAEWHAGAFASRSVDNLLKALSASKPASSSDIELDMPDIADGSNIQVSVSSRIPGTQSISLIVKRNREPLAATFHLTKEVEPVIRLDIGVERTSQIMALVEAEGKYYSYGREVKIAVPGCR